MSNESFFLLSKTEKFALCSFETKIGFGIGLPSYLKTKPKSALRKHRDVSPRLGGQSEGIDGFNFFFNSKEMFRFFRKNTSSCFAQYLYWTCGRVLESKTIPTHCLATSVCTYSTSVLLARGFAISKERNRLLNWIAIFAATDHHGSYWHPLRRTGCMWRGIR